MEEANLLKQALEACRSLHIQWEKNHEQRSEDFREFVSTAINKLDDAINKYVEKTDKRLTELETFKIQSEARLKVYLLIVSAGWSLAFFVLGKVWK